METWEEAEKVAELFSILWRACEQEGCANIKVVKTQDEHLESCN